MGGFVALADSTPTVDYSGVITTLGTACAGLQSGAQSAVSTVLPYALSIMGFFIVIGLGYKLIKRFAH